MPTNQIVSCNSADQQFAAPCHSTGAAPAAVNKITAMADNPLNAANRGVYISDNLPFLQRLNDECVDLVCIDPPFAKNETFGRKNAKSPDPLKPALSKAERATELALLKRWGISTPAQATAKGIDWPETAYKDFWSWERDVHEEWLRDIEDDYPAIAKLIDATRDIHGDGTAAYLCYMAVRLLEIKRVLKDTGSLYLHCDHTAGAYLRQLLDAVLGRNAFRNEVIWHYSGWNKRLAEHIERRHDVILFYAKAKNQTFNSPTRDWESQEEYVSRRRQKIHSDEHGREYVLSDGGGGKRVKRYLDEAMAYGVPLDDVWNIPKLNNSDKVERTGYPTQKPVALAERIIKASCPEDGVVLDCFAGCAYVAIAAERLGRNWVACDINARAWTVFKRQFSKPKLFAPNAPPTCIEPQDLPTGWQPNMFSNIVTVHGPEELPVRTTNGAHQSTPTLKLRDKPRKFKTPASIIPEPEMLEILLGISGYQAWCCGFANRLPDGTIIETTRNFHLDHLNPVSKDGTSHQIVNRAPLCPYHNIKKSNHRLHLAEYREAIHKAGEMMVADPAELIDLNYAANETLLIYADRQPQKRLPI